MGKNFHNSPKFKLLLKEASETSFDVNSSYDKEILNSAFNITIDSEGAYSFDVLRNPINSVSRNGDVRDNRDLVSIRQTWKLYDPAYLKSVTSKIVNIDFDYELEAQRRVDLIEVDQEIFYKELEQMSDVKAVLKIAEQSKWCSADEFCKEIPEFERIVVAIKLDSLAVKLWKNKVLKFWNTIKPEREVNSSFLS